DADAVLHAGESLRANHAARVVVERDMQGNKVAAAVDFVERDRFDADTPRALLSSEGVVSDNSSLETLHALRDGTPDLAESDDADSLAVDFRPDEFLPLPLPGVQAGIGLRDLAGERKQECDGEFGGGERIALRRVDDDDTFLRRRRHVNIIYTDA